jgi:hypothetical protein
MTPHQPTAGRLTEKKKKEKETCKEGEMVKATGRTARAAVTVVDVGLAVLVVAELGMRNGWHGVFLSFKSN